jgi:hypothetical protein
MRATVTVFGQDVTARRHGVMDIILFIGRMAARVISTTSCFFAIGTIGWCTRTIGRLQRQAMAAQ